MTIKKLGALQVVAGAISQEVVFFLAYRGGHPQAPKHVWWVIPITSIFIKKHLVDLHSNYCGNKKI